MEDAILESSKGATYLSFILDVEIVIKKEGKVNVAQTRVKSKNTRGSKDESENKEQAKTPERNKNQNVYFVTENQTNLSEIGNQQKIDECLFVEKSTDVNKRKSSSTEQNMNIYSENKKSDDNKNQKYKSFYSNETNPSESSNEKHHKRKRTHKSGNSSRMLKGKVEPIDYLECNRIFMCNYLQLSRHKSDSALYHNNLGTFKKEHGDMLEEKFQNVRSVSEILYLIKYNNSFYEENIDKKDCSNVKYLDKVCQQSCGDYNVTKTHETRERNFEKLCLIKNALMEKISTIDTNILHNYLKKKILREQTVKDTKDQFLVYNSKANLSYNLSPVSQEIVTLANEVDPLPNIKIEFNSNNDNLISRVNEPEDQGLTKCLRSAIKCDKAEGDLTNLKWKRYASNESKKTVSPAITTEEVVKLKDIKKNHSKLNEIAFFRRIKSMKRSLSFLCPIKLNLIRKQTLKKN